MQPAARPRIPVCRPLVGTDEAEAAVRVIQSAWLSTGSEAHAFEKDLGARLQSHIVAVSSASIGLAIGLAALDVRPGDEVIVPAITFVATSNAVLHLGARPVFADVDPTTGLMNADDALSRVTSRTRAIIPVDLYGQAADLTPYLRLAAKKPKIGIVRDAAQSLGTPGVGGQDGVIEVFSLYATKNVTAGEGGAIATRNQDLARRIRILSQQGVSADAYARYHGSTPYDVVEIGFKGNLADILAAIARVQLGKLDQMQSIRKHVCDRYRNEVALPTISWEVPTNYHLYPVFVDDREQFRASLANLGIGTGVHFECVPGHLAYRRLGYRPEDTPNAMAYGRREVTLPTFAGLTDEEVDRIVTAVAETTTASRLRPPAVIHEEVV